jgi:tRNA(Ile)-lysidine synthase
MHKLIKKIQIFAHRHNLWQKGDRIVVGISGGPDSVCLLDILHNLKKKKNFELCLAHVNYSLRGVDSKKDEILVRELAKEYALKIEVLDAKKISKNKINEDNLRNVRYDFFEKVRKENKFNLIAVAHNQDDQAETILMRLIRGSGLLGLSSIKPKNNKIVRPLLDISRKEIVEYLRENKLNYRIDRTNSESNFLRNKFRNKLIPLLEKEYNPVLRETLAGAVSNIAEDYDFIFINSKKVFKQIDFDKANNTYFFEAKKFLKNHNALQKQVLRQIIFELKNNLFNIDNNHLEEIIKIAKSDKNKSQRMIFKGLKVIKKGDIIYISTQAVK